jgi:asparagine synthase (glutamine-hydrolysing)
MRFFVLPDLAAASAALDALARGPERGNHVLRHASGRPWIVGDWRADEIKQVRAGNKQLVVLGLTVAGPGELDRGLAKAARPADLDGLLGSLPGRFHAIASFDGCVRAQGTVSTVCQIFHATVEGVVVLADRPDSLIAATHAGLDLDVLATQLLAPYGPPWPLCNDALWHGVQAVDGVDYARLDRTGGLETVRWWRPPEPVLSLDEGAERIRDALLTAVRLRAGASPLSMDLSGGMDSTSLCFLAQHSGLDFGTVHGRSMDPANEDGDWAAFSRRRLPDAGHVTIGTDYWACLYSDGTEADPDASLERPYLHTPRRLTERLARAAVAQGAVRYVTGHGSDELFRTDITWLNAMFRARPWRMFPAVRKAKARWRWTLPQAVRLMRRPPPFERWLAGLAGRLEQPTDWMPMVGWDLERRMPTWATPDALAAVRRRFRQACTGSAGTVAADPVQNLVIRLLQNNGMVVRQSSRVGERFGVSFEAPYADDRVLEIALSIRLEERVRDGANKPVLAAAMRGLVPDELLDRRYKGTPTRDLFQVLRSNRSFLVDMCEESRLVRLGLADGRKLRETVLGLHAGLATWMPLDPTWACEMWLRNLQSERTPT